MPTRLLNQKHHPFIPEKPVKSLRPHRHLIDSKLVTQLRLFSIIALAMLGVILFDVARNEISILLAVSGLLIGVAVGIVVSRMRRLSWDEQAAQSDRADRLDWRGDSGPLYRLYADAQLALWSLGTGGHVGGFHACDHRRLYAGQSVWYTLRHPQNTGSVGPGKRFTGKYVYLIIGRARFDPGNNHRDLIGG